MLDEELFQDFIEHRKYLKKPMSPVAEKRMKMKLERWLEEGYDVTAMVERSITNGWQDVYAKEDDKKRRPASHKQGVTPTLGHTADREAARANVVELMRKVKGQ